MSSLTTRQTFALVALFVITSVAFIQLDNRDALDPVKSGLRQVVSPVSHVFDRIVDRTGDQSSLAKQLATVTAERNALLAENAQLKAQADEVTQLRAQLGLKQDHPGWVTVQANVITADPANENKFITIDKGAADGIKVGMAVVDPKLYVGQVTQVWDHSARVTLIIDMSQQVGAEIQGVGADGVVYGMWQRGGRAEMRHVDRDIKLKGDELVVTSDKADSSTAQVPGNIIIGRINGTPVRNDQSDSLTIPILPLCNFDNLRVVSVIISANGQ